MMMIGGAVNFARLHWTAKLTTAVIRLKLLKFLFHNSKPIVEIIIPRSSMLKVQDREFLAFPFLNRTQIVEAEFCAERHHILYL
jgi:hypothetical protein